MRFSVIVEVNNSEKSAEDKPAGLFATRNVSANSKFEAINRAQKIVEDEVASANIWENFKIVNSEATQISFFKHMLRGRGKGFTIFENF